MKFLQISTQRSGTTFLSDLLASHPRIYMCRELFKVDGDTLNIDKDNYRYFMNRLSVNEFLDRYYSKYQREYDTIGFTIMLNHLQKFPEIISYAKKNNIKCIYLERKNRLSIAFSRSKARATGIYHTDKIIHSNPITVCFNDLINELEKIMTSIDILRTIADELDAYKVYYEDLDSNRVEVLNAIQSYLNTPVFENLYSPLIKTSSTKLDESIKNYHELIRKLENNSENNELTRLL